MSSPRSTARASASARSVPAHAVHGLPLRHDRDRTVDLEHRELHLLDGIHAVLAGRHLELFLVDTLLAQVGLDELPFLDEDGRGALDESSEAAAAKTEER